MSATGYNGISVGSVHITGGTVIATGTGSSSSGIGCGSKVTISGGNAPVGSGTVTEPVQPEPEPEPGTVGPQMFPGVFHSLPFADVQWGDWFFDEVTGAYEAGLINGMTSTTYDPHGDLTVAQAIKLAAVLHQLGNWGKVTLTNGRPNWYDSYVDYAVENGVIEASYTYYNSAQMNAPATRREFVHIFYEAMPESSYYGWNTVADNAIPDVKLGDQCADEIYTFYRTGILTGAKADGSFLPGSNIKRSEVAAILIRMYDTGARQSVYLP